MIAGPIGSGTWLTTTVLATRLLSDVEGSKSRVGLGLAVVETGTLLVCERARERGGKASPSVSACGGRLIPSIYAKHSISVPLCMLTCALHC